jgi:hypothetical protein
MSVTRINSLLAICILMLAAIGCNDEGTITKLPVKETQSEDLHKKPETNALNDKIHIVTVNEVLPTSKYVYLNVNEGDEQFWVAAIKQEANVGDSYMYKGGILKRNFESKEYNRVFDVVYLVTNLVPVKKAPKTDTDQLENTETENTSEELTLIEHEGSIKISELVSNPKKYEGQSVQLSGRVSKINPNIMKRNWIHLQDGSKDDYDLVITSDTFVPEGSIITVKGTVTLNIDFGAGYQYDILVENGILTD